MTLAGGQEGDSSLCSRQRTNQCQEPQTPASLPPHDPLLACATWCLPLFLTQSLPWIAQPCTPPTTQPFQEYVPRRQSQRYSLTCLPTLCSNASFAERSSFSSLPKEDSPMPGPGSLMVPLPSYGEQLSPLLCIDFKSSWLWGPAALFGSLLSPPSLCQGLAWNVLDIISHRKDPEVCLGDQVKPAHSLPACPSPPPPPVPQPPSPVASSCCLPSSPLHYLRMPLEQGSCNAKGSSCRVCGLSQIPASHPLTVATQPGVVGATGSCGPSLKLQDQG